MTIIRQLELVVATLALMGAAALGGSGLGHLRVRVHRRAHHQSVRQRVTGEAGHSDLIMQLAGASTRS